MWSCMKETLNRKSQKLCLQIRKRATDSSFAYWNKAYY